MLPPVDFRAEFDPVYRFVLTPGQLLSEINNDASRPKAPASRVEAFLLTALLGHIGPLQIAHRKMHKNFLLRACRQKC
jgi:hypothetical protein